MESYWVYGRAPLKDFEEKLPASQFIKTHRSYIVAKRKVVSRKGKELEIRDHKGNIHTIPISDKYLKAVEEDPDLKFE